MEWEIWLGFAAISIINIITPGPAILNTIRRATQLDLKLTLSSIVGNVLGLGVAGAFCAGGVATFVVASETLMMIFRWAGIAYLTWLGLKLILVREDISLPSDSMSVINVSSLALVGEGFLIAVTNPKAVLFFLAIFPQVIRPDSELFPQAAILVTSFCLFSFISLSGYAILASVLRTRFLSQVRYSIFRKVSGCILLIFAGRMIREAR